MKFTRHTQFQILPDPHHALANRKKRSHLFLCVVALALPAVAWGHAAQAPTEKAPQTPQKNSAAKKNSVRSSTPKAKECYAIQVGAYKDREEAIATQNELARQFPNATQVSQLPSSTEIYWRVRMLAASKEEAQSLVRRLQKTRWNKSWIVPNPCS